ncbi:unnamed protein product [Parnassius apollo]|uniref:(apollo) hypothetical protein n=1 Tax=Parnassius apollo TaxID=110799 RepID=A0A8S3W0A3_PARAO|nr:unnamed protein product [Parnassius apollo]
MSDKRKYFATPISKTTITKRQSSVPATTSKLPRIPTTSIKEKNVLERPRINNNITVIGEGDRTINKAGVSGPEFESLYRQIAYGRFLRTMLEDCLVEEKIEREETQMDIQMAQLADRFKKTMDQLDKTNRRLKEISFVVEQKRLLDLKSQDYTKFHEISKNSNAESILTDLAATEQTLLDKLETKNVDFGYDKESGHKQLLDAVNDAIEGLEEIKKHSNLDINKFKEYKKIKTNLNVLEKVKLDLVSLKSDFDSKFPKFSERLLKEASEKIAMMMNNDDDEDDDEDDDADD